MIGVLRRWGRLSLRWQLVALNGAVVVVSGLAFLLLAHRVMQPSFMDLMHEAGDPPNAAAGQMAYNTAVDHQIVPAIAIAAVVALLLNFAVVTLALRPLRAVQDATRRLAVGDVAARIDARRGDEIGEVAHSVDELAESLERLEGLRRQVTIDVAHELRTPVQNVLGLVDAMRDGVVPTDPNQLDRVRAEIGRLVALIEDLGALADAQLARDRLARESVPLGALAREVVAGFSPAMTKRKIDVRVDVEPAGADVVVGDPGRLAQVLRNILANAARHANQGSTVEVVVRPADSGAAVRVAVLDRGDGIPPEAVPFIFERFFRVDRARGRERGGAGIGLAIVRELVAAHGGEVGASSEGDQVTVWFELPRAARSPGVLRGQTSGAGRRR